MSNPRWPFPALLYKSASLTCCHRCRAGAIPSGSHPCSRDVTIMAFHLSVSSICLVCPSHCQHIHQHTPSKRYPLRVTVCMVCHALLPPVRVPLWFVKLLSTLHTNLKCLRRKAGAPSTLAVPSEAVRSRLFPQFAALGSSAKVYTAAFFY